MKRVSRVVIIFIAAVLLLVPSAYAENSYPEPTPGFFVNDFANVLGQDTRDKILSIGKQLEDKTTAQVVLVTADTVNGQDVFDYAVGLFTKWGIGQKGKDNGVLIFDAVKERKLWIITGYGLEGALPDAKTAEIRQNYMNPYLKNNDYNSGLLNGYVAVVNEVAKEYGVSIDAGMGLKPQANDRHSIVTYPSSTHRRNINVFPIFIVLFIIADAIFFRFRITSAIIKILFWSSFFGGRGGWGGRGGFGGGGFGGGWGGGGGFGGGGFGGSSGGGGSTGGGGSGGGY